MRQRIVAAARGLIQIGVGCDEADVCADQPAEQLGLIIGFHQALDGAEHHRMMGDDQICTVGDGLVNDGIRHIQGKVDACDGLIRMAQQQPGIIKAQLGVKGGALVDEINNLLYGQHVSSSNLLVYQAISACTSRIASSSGVVAASKPRSLS